MLPKYLTAAYPIEKHLFLTPRFALRIIGVYPETDLTVWVMLWAAFSWVVLLYGDYAEFAYGAHYLPIDVLQALDAFCPVASSIMSLAKISVVLWHRERLKLLIENIRAMTEAQQGSEKSKIKEKYYLIATRFSGMVMFFGMCTSTAYSLRPIIRNILAFVQGTEFAYETPFNMIFPHRLLSMPLYPITFLFSHWHGYATVLAFAGVDGFFLGTCMYFTVLLKCLQEDLKEVLNDQDALSIAKERDPTLEAAVAERMLNIVEQHNAIADLVKEFSFLMEEITLSHFISSSLIICMCIVDLLLFSGYGAALYVIHTCAVLTELFMYCYGGTAVMESSAELANIAYSSYWYTHGIKVQKMTLLLIIRAQRCFLIKVPFFAPSLPAFAAILRFSGSLIALVQSIL